MKTIAIIPARGGSTRIPRKNLAQLAGKPLIAYTIQAALAARHIDGVFISTNDAEIAAVARDYQAKVIWRPDELCTATSPTEPAIQHAVDQIEQNQGHRVEIVILLQATSPLRGTKRIDQAVDLLRQSGCDAVASVVPDIHYYFLHELGPDSRLDLGFDPNHRLRTQDIPPKYRENGAVYAMTRSQIMDRECRMGGDVRALVMDEYESIDVDTPLDLQLCETILQSGY
jgi:CMP-N-acetylneuraminic acid synthetase